MNDLRVSMHIGRNAACIQELKVVVISSAVKPDNPEVLAAYPTKVPVILQGEILTELMCMKFGIAVAGSHGKTTTTSRVAQIRTRATSIPQSS
jgi:UDP-N-acetylmuramate--alanine ligase